MNLFLGSGLVTRTSIDTFLCRFEDDHGGAPIIVVCVEPGHLWSAGDILSLVGRISMRRIGAENRFCIDVRHAIKRPPRDPDSGVIVM